MLNSICYFKNSISISKSSVDYQEKLGSLSHLLKSDV